MSDSIEKIKKILLDEKTNLTKQETNNILNVLKNKNLIDNEFIKKVKKKNGVKFGYVNFEDQEFPNLEEYNKKVLQLFNNHKIQYTTNYFSKYYEIYNSKSIFNNKSISDFNTEDLWDIYISPLKSDFFKVLERILELLKNNPNVKVFILFDPYENNFLHNIDNLQIPNIILTINTDYTNFYNSFSTSEYDIYDKLFLTSQHVKDIFDNIIENLTHSLFKILETMIDVPDNLIFDSSNIDMFPSYSVRYNKVRNVFISSSNEKYIDKCKQLDKILSTKNDKNTSSGITNIKVRNIFYDGINLFKPIQTFNPIGNYNIITTKLLRDINNYNFKNVCGIFKNYLSCVSYKQFENCEFINKLLSKGYYKFECTIVPYLIHTGATFYIILKNNYFKYFYESEEAKNYPIQVCNKKTKIDCIKLDDIDNIFFIKTKNEQLNLKIEKLNKNIDKNNFSLYKKITIFDFDDTNEIIKFYIKRLLYNNLNY